MTGLNAIYNLIERKGKKKKKGKREPREDIYP